VRRVIEGVTQRAVEGEKTRGPELRPKKDTLAALPRRGTNSDTLLFNRKESLTMTQEMIGELRRPGGGHSADHKVEYLRLSNSANHVAIILLTAAALQFHIF